MIVNFYFRVRQIRADVTMTPMNRPPPSADVEGTKTLKRSIGRDRSAEENIVPKSNPMSIYEFREEDFDVDQIVIGKEDATIRTEVKRGRGRPKKIVRDIPDVKIGEPPKLKTEHTSPKITKTSCSTSDDTAPKQKLVKRRSSTEAGNLAKKANAKQPGSKMSVAEVGEKSKKNPPSEAPLMKQIVKPSKLSTEVGEKLKSPAETAVAKPTKKLVKPTELSRRTFFTQERLQPIVISGEENFDEEEGATEWVKDLSERQVSFWGFTC